MSKFVCLSDTARGLREDSDPTALLVFHNKGPEDSAQSALLLLYYCFTTPLQSYRQAL
jgi:hypothetical protein